MGKKEPHILLKLDISKAFDSVAWPFLLEVLQQLGFGHRWCNLLCLLLSTSTTQILLNGEPGEMIHIIEAFAKVILYPQCFSFLSWMC